MDETTPQFLGATIQAVEHGLSAGLPGYLALAALAVLLLAVAVLFIRQRHRKRLAPEHKRIIDAIECIDEGFALFDQNDRLLVCNQPFRDMYPDFAHRLVPGIPFAEVLCLSYGENAIVVANNPTAQPVASHSQQPFEIRLKDGRYFRVTERKTREDGTVVVHTDITHLKQVQQQLQQQATHDTLTGLLNRNHFHEQLAQAVAQSRRHGQRMAIMLFNLDRFKQINNTLGHAASDELLIAVARRLHNCLREYDTAAHLGADEFAAILPNMDDWRGVSVVAERILETLCGTVEVSGAEVVVTASIGIALFPDDADDAASLLKNADAACYHAKALGRNNFQFYTAEMNAKAAQRFALEKHLRHAVERGELRVHYQPQLDLNSGRIISMEALLRWQNPVFGVLAPEHFIPLAEETGLITVVGEWVLRAGCAQHQAWRAQGLSPGRVCVNVSPRQFYLQNLTHLVQQALHDTGLDPADLALEITESAVMDNVEQALVTLHELNALGIKLFLDDFGTGYSSLSRLKRFPLHALKIDRSFVHDIATNADSLAIVRAMIAMAHHLNLKVVAEGVETEAQLNLLVACGCDAIQGFYLSQPMTAAATARFLNIDSGNRAISH